jgi:hypothetical protein
MATLHARSEYDKTQLNFWNDAPLSTTNQPTYAQDQLSADLNFYLDPAQRGELFVSVTNVFDTQYGVITGSPFDLVALTGFDFSLRLSPSASLAPVTFSNQWANAGESLRGPVAGGSAPLTTTPGWNLVGVSGPPNQPDYSFSTPTVNDALTHFSSVSGETRIYGGATFEFLYGPNGQFVPGREFRLSRSECIFWLR